MRKKLDFVPIVKGFSEIGVSLHNVFPDYDVAERLYEGYSWFVLRSEDLVVIHAVPPEEAIGEKGWEQWFASSDTEPSHQVLFRNKPDAPFHSVLDTSEVEEPILPEGVASGRWFVVKLDTLMGKAFADL